MKVLRLTLGREPWRLRVLLPVRNPSFGAACSCGCHFCDGLKYRKSGGGWFLRTGISIPSPLM